MSIVETDQKELLTSIFNVQCSLFKRISNTEQRIMNNERFFSQLFANAIKASP